MSNTKKIFSKKIKKIKKRKLIVKNILFSDYLKKYQERSSDLIIDRSNEILQSLDSSKERVPVSIEQEYDALLTIMENRLMGKYSFDNRVGLYPDYEDPDFSKKLTKKKEFYINKIAKKSKLNKDETELLSKKMCDPEFGITDKRDVRFNLTSNQKFLKSFLSPHTPYNGALLFHGTGVGKTCTSISIAEQYSEELAKMNKKIYIILNPSIEANFRKNIFNAQKIKQGLVNYQCTGSKYLDEISVSPEELEGLDIDKLQFKINKVINNRYKFFGYIKFANYIKKIITTIKERFDKSQHNKLIKKKIQDIFSNSVMIIDEVHNVKDSTSTLLPPHLDLVVKHAKNMKLLLLSATPMFNSADEIIYLINLLLSNDDKPRLVKNEFFDKNNNFVTKSRMKFLNKIRGYVSYMRGEDPLRFPLRVDPSNFISYKKMPMLDRKGREIPEDMRIRELKIVGCKMNGFQLDVYKNLIEDKNNYGNFDRNAQMASNIVFPIEDPDIVKVDNLIGDRGFDEVIETSKLAKKVKYDVKVPEMFDLANIGKYSCKIKEIVENIMKSEGICFVYSQYKKSGVLPLALALESAGYSKYDGSLLRDKAPSISKGSYIILSGDNDLSKNAYKEYLKVQDENKNGEKIKIILGTETAAEGLDFSYIRQVHILEPWFHINKFDQVIGRAIRNCSHIALPVEKRTVQVFLYAAIKSDNPSKDIETIDLENYRRAENKSRVMSEVEYLLKISAVDCNLNIHGNKFETDVDFSRKCNYRECDFKCEPDVSVKDHTELNDSTLKMNVEIVKDNVNETITKIKDLYKSKYLFLFSEIVDLLKKDKFLVFLALSKIVLDKLNVRRQDTIGNIIYKNGYYIFLKKNMSKFVSMNNLRAITKKHIGKLDISRNNVVSMITSEKKKLQIAPKPGKIHIIVAPFNINVRLRKEFEKLNKMGVKLGLDKKYNFNIATSFNSCLSVCRDNLFQLDKLSISEKEKLTQYLISKQAKTELKDIEKIVFDKLYNVLLFNRDVYYRDLTHQEPEEKVWGYKIVYGSRIKYKKYNPETNMFSNATKSEITQIEKSFSKKDHLPYSDIIGYYEYNPKKQTTFFKIIDTSSSKKSKRKMGIVCDNDGMKKDYIIDYINSLSDKKIYNIDEPIPPKSVLCAHLELMFRYKDITDKTKRYFLGVEETLEYKLND